MIAARSSSPISSRPSNPNPKTLRKSGTFDLSKSCSGSEIPRRNSTSKPTSTRPSPRSSFELKENQRDPDYSKPARTKSPSINPSNGMKGFMAPTISASSKITAASPRKKILVERNQVVRDCMENNIVSTEEVKREEISQKLEIDFDSEEISGQTRSTKLDISSSNGYDQIAATRSLDAGASDADTSLPPYDPMKNYLSPRPRFLHYKPNPRIEKNHEFMEDLLYVGEGRRLEDSFSDSEGSQDCSGYTDQSSPIEEPEDDNLMKTQQAQVPDENHVFDSKPRPGMYKPKAWSFGRFKLIPFLLVLSVLLFSVPLTDSPILSPSIMKDQSLAGPLTLPFRVFLDIHLFDYVDVVSKNFQGLATKMRQWSINSIEILISSGYFSREELGVSHSFNTTLSSPMIQSAGSEFCSSSDLELGEKEIIVNRQNDLVDYMEMKFELDKIGGETLLGNDEDAEKIKVEFYEDVNEASTELVERMMEEGNNPKCDQLESFVDSAVQVGTIIQFEKIENTISEKILGEGYSVGFNMAEKLEEQVLIGLGKENIQSINKEDINSTAYSVDETQMANKNDFDAVSSIFPDNKLLILVVLGMFVSVALATKLISLFIAHKKKIPSSIDKPLNKKTRSVFGGTESCKHASGDLCCNRGELAEMVCDSGPTEMSSSFNNRLSFNKQGSNIGIHNVTPSNEILQRRESGVSSSISYGSYTSFERSSRKGNKQEQVFTPVRRSSRIRNQVSSP